jgi:hypothetical protein
MMLTRRVAVSLLISVFALSDFQMTCAAPAAIPDLSGTWKIDRNLSTYGRLKDLDDLIFIISQNDPVLNVKRVLKKKRHKDRMSELNYYTDGRGEKIQFLFGGEQFNSKTGWEGDRLVSKFTVTEYLSTTSDFYYLDYKEMWELSKEGKVLTITTEIAVRNVPYFYRNIITPETYRKVFEKIQ